MKTKTFLTLLTGIIFTLGLQGCSWNEFSYEVGTRLQKSLKYQDERAQRVKEEKMKETAYLTSGNFYIADIKGTYRDPLNNKAYQVQPASKFYEGEKPTDANTIANKYPYDISCSGNNCNVHLNIIYKISSGIYRTKTVNFDLVKNGSYWEIVYIDPSDGRVKTYPLGYMDKGDRKYVTLSNNTYNISFTLEAL